MKKLLLFLMFVMGMVGAKAYDYSYLTFEASDGSLVAVSVDGLTISVSDATLVVTPKGEDSSYTFVLSSLSKMYFTDDATALQPLAANSDLEVKAYTTDGILLGTYANAAAAKAALGKGVYVLKTKSLTFKLSVR